MGEATNLKLVSLPDFFHEQFHSVLGNLLCFPSVDEGHPESEQFNSKRGV